MVSRVPPLNNYKNKADWLLEVKYRGEATSFAEKLIDSVHL